MAKKESVVVDETAEVEEVVEVVVPETKEHPDAVLVKELMSRHYFTPEVVRSFNHFIESLK